ncbi:MULTISPECIES: CDF family cation-efflux transporter FieF [Vibrio]|uniref:Cation-efflux pump FieF n=1 Tax=Vibrio casei TaxID=673372 RepID=A0A368LKJ9_9VIBR|nr:MULTISPECIES: CDF family cation-efflux transporter FieF [Vibrio]RCS72316.1 CDF family cation-efflux pump FieF [Vibrio casei]SJN29797.1 Cobalt-zinc-cadmium resistance protein [Vibrio casei]HBV77989.1 CDF family cation-efflux pump FieF [Vibrio sp.]
MQKNYAKLVNSAAWAAMIIATILLLVKLVAWWQTNSVSLLASLVDSFLDMAASLTNLLVVRYALQPADEEHRFGHGKAESLAALAQSMFISGSAVFLVLNGVERYFRPQDLVSPELGVWVSGFAILLTSGLVLFQKHVVRKTGSQAISADSLHYQTDLLMNIAIMIALVLSWYGLKQADAIFAIGIGIYILYSAYQMASEAVQSLLDRQLPDDEVQAIHSACISIDGVLGAHDLRTRMSGPVRFIQVHIELDDHLPLLEAHRISDAVESRIDALFPHSDVLIHQDPISVVPAEKYQPLN